MNAGAARKHVLVLDHDMTTRTKIADVLAANSIRVSLVSEERELRRLVAMEIADAMIVEVNSSEALATVRDLASLTHTPIIVTSADLIDEDDKVRGLEAGAVDYLVKPFGYREFMARLTVAMRDRTSPLLARDRRGYRFDDYKLSVRQRCLIRLDGSDVKLTTAEFNLLIAFLNAPRQVLSREQLLSTSRVHSEEIFDRSLDPLILRLRRKIEKDLASPVLIKTVRGVGYVLETDVEVDERPRLRRQVVQGT
jgi:DNA-binding response OmpR family regulator